MEQNEVRITCPPGMEIDKENSTFECIRFKPINKRWRDDINNTVRGFYINADSEIVATDCMHLKNTEANYNIFATKKQAKHALAMARISQIMANDERFGGVVTDEEWENKKMEKCIICRECNGIYTKATTHAYTILAFHTIEQRDLFMEENMDLIKDYYML